MYHFNELGTFADVGPVPCVECPACGFTFAADHKTDPAGCYQCDCGYEGDAPKKSITTHPKEGE